MVDLFAITKELADIQEQLRALPEDAREERFRLHRRQDELRAIARSVDNPMDAGRSDADLLAELKALRQQMQSIEKQRIDLVMQAGSGGASTGEMGNLGGVESAPVAAHGRFHSLALTLPPLSVLMFTCDAAA